MVTMVPLLIGKNVELSITALSPNSAGVFTEGTTLPMTGKAERASLRFRKVSDQVTAMDASIPHNLALGNEWELGLVGIKRTGGTNPNPLEGTSFSADYAKVIILTVLRRYTFWGMIQELDWPIDRGINRETFSLIPIDIGAPNPLVDLL